MTEPTGKTVQCVVVTPERTVLDATVDFVALPMFDGELGVLAGRAPLIGRLGPGELRTKRGTDVQRFYVDGGFAQVRSDVVTVLTPRALRASEINPDVVARASQPGQAPASAEARARAEERARVQMRIARHGQGGGGTSHH
jgi:F-type H+-transporting ATPase subunit epsilon